MNNIIAIIIGGIKCIGIELLLKIYLQKKENYLISRPKSADSIFSSNNLKKYDCFISMYHDQELILFKLISQYSGLNYIGGISINRVSPDHGTVYNVVGKNKGNSESLLYCFNMLKKITHK